MHTINCYSVLKFIYFQCFDFTLCIFSMSTYTFSHMCEYTYSPTHKHICIYTQTQHTHRKIHTQTNVYTYTYVHSLTQTHTHTLKYTMYMQQKSSDSLELESKVVCEPLQELNEVLATELSLQFHKYCNLHLITIQNT